MVHVSKSILAITKLFFQQIIFQLKSKDCDGPAYLFSGDLISKLYNASLYTKNFVFEDVYIGMLAHQLNSTFDSDFSWSYAYLSHDNLINTTHRDLDDYFIVYTDYYIGILFHRQNIIII
jgi:hypothetical protein